MNRQQQFHFANLLVVGAVLGATFSRVGPNNAATTRYHKGDVAAPGFETGAGVDYRNAANVPLDQAMAEADRILFAKNTLYLAWFFTAVIFIGGFFGVRHITKEYSGNPRVALAAATAGGFVTTAGVWQVLAMAGVVWVGVLHEQIRAAGRRADSTRTYDPVLFYMSVLLLVTVCIVLFSGDLSKIKIVAQATAVGVVMVFAMLSFFPGIYYSFGYLMVFALMIFLMLQLTTRDVVRQNRRLEMFAIVMSGAAMGLVLGYQPPARKNAF